MVSGLAMDSRFEIKIGVSLATGTLGATAGSGRLGIVGVTTVSAGRVGVLMSAGVVVETELEMVSFESTGALT